MEYRLSGTDAVIITTCFMVLLVSYIQESNLNDVLLNDSCTRCMMYSLDNRNESMYTQEELDMYDIASPYVKGYYSTSNYYCAWFNDVEPESLRDTEEHEIGHFLVHRDYEHYCED